MIYSFTATPLPRLAQVGGKGLSLMRMTQADLPVPPGFVLAVAFFEPWMSRVQATPEWADVQTAIQNKADLGPSTAALKVVCGDLALTVDQEKQLAEALRALSKDSLFANGEALYAARSSSPEEDLEGASFAGGYTTTLGVTQETLLDAIRAAFVSAFDERVFVYKQQQGFATDNPRIAVVIQQQIAAESAGVGFSLNPLNNDYDKAVIDANWGLGESVVAGMVSPDHFVVDKVTQTIVEKQVGDKGTAVYLAGQGGIEERPGPTSAEFCLTGAQVLEITAMLCQIETLYGHPIDIEWAYAGGTLYLLQARPITAYVPLPPEMLSAPGERRTLYFDATMQEGLTMNAPVSPLALDWYFWLFSAVAEPFAGPVDLKMDANPHKSLLFGAGGRMYANISQLLTIISPKHLAAEMRPMDQLAADLLQAVDAKTYRAQKKNAGLRWGRVIRSSIKVAWHARHIVGQTIKAALAPRRFYHEVYEPQVPQALRAFKSAIDDDLPLDAFITKYSELYGVILGTVSLPSLIPYIMHLYRIPRLFARSSEDMQALADKLTLGAVGNEAIDLGIRLYRMSQMLTAVDFADLDQLATRLEQRQLGDDFLNAWDQFIDQYGFRGPAEMDLASTRYGDDPLLALEQMSYMVDGDFDPEAALRQNVAERKAAYEKLLTMVSGRKRRKLQKSYKMVELLAPTRDTPKYMLVLYVGALRQRMLREGEKFVAQGRLDEASHVFTLTLTELERSQNDPDFDLRQARAAKQSLYRKLKRVLAFPHLIDSRGRIGQVEKSTGDPNVLTGLGISRGVATGRIKVLHSPREKPVEKGDVLVAYTTDPGWTPLFINATAIILEIGSMLQHGGVVAREYGKPCVAGIQGVTTTLQDGQLVEVDGTTGVVRILEE